ncbi:MAG TPA: dihydroorotase [Treponema sp.]|nr:dihydroorotase [Treponema sp.]
MINALLIYNARLLDESTDTPGALLVIDDKIRAVYTGYFTNRKTVEALALSVLAEDGYTNCAVEYHDAGGLTLSPAFIDMHAHFRYPGQTQKEDLNTGLHAAVAGGFGTVVAMPNTTPVVSSRDMALSIDGEAASLNLANFIQSVSITRDFGGSDASHIDSLDPSHVPLITEDGHEVASAAVMLDAMRKAAKLGLIVSCHSEDPSLAEAAKPYRQEALKIMEQYHLPAWGTAADEDDIPDAVLDKIEMLLTQADDLLALAENTATLRNITLAREAGCHVHIAHVSTAAAMDAVRAAKDSIRDEEADYAADEADAAYDAAVEGTRYTPPPRAEQSFRITCEVTPHHLALCGTDEPFIRALVNPPLRSEDDRVVLLEGLRDGTVDVISTDHAPHTSGDKAAGAPGFTGLETAYAVCNTVLVAEGQLSAKRLSQLMSANPARILHLNKGLLVSGCDADLVLTDPEEKWTVDSSVFLSKGKATPFDGMVLTGKVRELFIGGKKVL